MPRPTRKTKPLIYVFNEGESDQAYTEFLKTSFSDYAVVKYPKATGLFEVARDRFEKEKNIGTAQKSSMRFGSSLMLKKMRRTSGAPAFKLSRN